MNELSGGQPRILVVRLSAIGDCVLTVPLVHALRNGYPNSHLVWIVDERSAALLDGLPGLDELLVIPRRWHRSFSSIIQIRRALRQRAFDITIDPQSLTKSAFLGLMSGAKRRICFASPEGRELAPWLANRRVHPTRDHLVDRTLQLLEPLGVELPAKVVFDLPEYPGTEAIINFVNACIGKAKDFAVINVGAGWPSKLWCADRFAGVVRYLGAEHGISSVILWHGAEREMAVDVVSQSGGYGHLAPVTSLTELATLSREARLFVGCDTGPLHIAAAVGTPCVGIYGPTPPARCGPYGTRHLTVQPEGGFQVVRMRRAEENSVMRMIRIEQVTAACGQLLKQSTTRRTPRDETVAASPSTRRCTALSSQLTKTDLTAHGA